MDFSFSSEQEIFRTSIRKFLAKNYSKEMIRENLWSEIEFPSELWKQIAEFGWLGIPFPEKYGGSDVDFGGFRKLVDLTILFEEVGRACFVGPLFSTLVLGGLLILDVGDENQKQTLLNQLIGGKKLCTLALCEPDFYYNEEEIMVKATRSDNKYIIEGTKLFVADVKTADFLICVARTSEVGTSLFICNPDDSKINCFRLKTISGDWQYEVSFNKVEVPTDGILGELDNCWPAVQKSISRAALLKSAEMLGGSQMVMEMCLEYVKDRKQFGRVIGSYQTIQHYCANMAIDIAMSRDIIYRAAWKSDQGINNDIDIAMAKAWSSDVYRKIVQSAHQIFGAIGWCAEHDLSFYLRHAKACEVNYGDACFQRQIIASSLLD